MGTVTTTTFSSNTETVTKTKLNGLVANLLTEFNGKISDANISDTAAINVTKLTVTSAAAGDILYHNGTSFVRLAKGSDGEVLTLASGVPTWA